MQPQTKRVSYCFRQMLQEDVDSCVELCFWQKADSLYEDEIRKQVKGRNMCVVAEYAGVIRGYIIYHLKKDHIEILTIVGKTDETFRQILDYMKGKLHRARQKHLQMLVDHSHTDMHMALVHNGFLGEVYNSFTYLFKHVV